MNKNLLAASAATLAMALTVASCGNASDPKLNQTGATPDLPQVNETLVPAMKISPPAGWNGKYRQEGNGGWAGAINYGSLIDPLRRGYAVAATDDGHEANGLGASWAIGHPEKLIDFGYRAVHETSVQAKAMTQRAATSQR